MEIIIGKNAGFCYGVKRAVDNSMLLMKNNKEKANIYCLGELVHNKQVIQNLEQEGLIFVEDINQITEKNTKLIIRAHGIPKNTYKIAEDKLLTVKDFTCPNVLKIHKIVEQYKSEKTYIFLTGSNNHPEVKGILSNCGDMVSIITEKENITNAIEDFNKTDCKKLVLISQTTYSLEKFKDIEFIIKEQLGKDIKFICRNTICPATEIRQNETEQLSKNVDYMIIIGGKNSSNTKKLFEIASKNCAKSISIETYKDLYDMEFVDTVTVGIMAGASTPQSSIDEVIIFLKNKKSNEQLVEVF